MVTQDLQTRDNLILGTRRKILILINDQLQLPGKIKGKKLTAEEITNHLHHRQVILVVIQTQTQATITTMTIKEETIAGAEEADIRNATLEDYQFLEIHLPVWETY